MSNGYDLWLERPYQEMYARAEHMERVQEGMMEYADEIECVHALTAAKRPHSPSKGCPTCLGPDEVYYSHMMEVHGGCAACEEAEDERNSPW